ncbi:ABC transporter permease [Ramlibacter sp.]|uniref:ABC transporter permease n=1 Tax=Ramlibacter sp. TaxID=1917967 RepID=UPI002FC8A97B
MSPTTARWILLGALLVAWEAAPRLGLIHTLFLPPLTDALQAAWRSWPMYLENTVVTLWQILAALAIACGGGIALGALIGSVPGLRRSMTPLLSSAYAIPLVVLYPLMAAWFGIGASSQIAFAGLYGIIPAALATAAGIQSIDPQLSLTARSMGATLGQRIVHVVLPAAIPSVLNGIRIGGALAIVGVVLAQMLVSTEGLGFVITTYRTMLDGAHVFAAILFVLAIALAFDWCVGLLERRTAAWNPSSASKS